ncbi:MarR family transcriptional regulator [Acidianus ambivalens]|uniref:Winged helix-turn-helix transcriptional regulator n=1 Tax=Acidianus ambivalens TaxID=2283 RepID=A0A650CY84_ACIAM|nr:helix-turn-helix domain-containing protein [Acidianus ambivalens]MQL56415.1 hypothetical protein [Acidianus ambivalens]QGR22829.1 hypothetical protein D1866_02725 [Acidianus ambivalens]
MNVKLHYLTYERTVAKTKILLVLAKRGLLTLEDLERCTKIPRASILKNLSELKKEGKITRGTVYTL